MDLKTGKTYHTQEEALADGVSPSDLYRVPKHGVVEERLRQGKPIVKFSKGSFKSYLRRRNGKLVQIS